MSQKLICKVTEKTDTLNIPSVHHCSKHRDFASEAPEIGSVMASALGRVKSHVQQCALTLLVEFPDDGVQVGVLERNVTSSHRHLAAQRRDPPRRMNLEPLKDANKAEETPPGSARRGDRLPEEGWRKMERGAPVAREMADARRWMLM